MTSDVVAWVDGVVGDGTVVTTSGDRGLTVGAGVFETLRTVGGRPFTLDRHLARLHQSAGIAGVVVPVDDATLAGAVDEVVAAWAARHGAPGADAGATGPGAAGGSAAGGGEVRLRITVTAGARTAGATWGSDPGRVMVTATGLVPYGPTATVVTSPWRFNEFSPTAGAKTTSYVDNVVALDDARSRGADEALVANTAGDLCEAATANVFVVLDGELVTPPLASGCLPGVTRALLLEAGCGTERTVPMAEVVRATEVFLTSTIRGVQTVATVDGVVPGSGQPDAQVPGPHTQAAAAVLADLHRLALDGL